MKNINLLKISAASILAAMCFIPSAVAMEEVSLEQQYGSESTLDINKITDYNYNSDYDFTTSVIMQSSDMLLSEDSNLRLAQAANMLAQNVQLDAGITKDSADADIAEASGSEDTFFGRVFKEDNRYRALQMFNEKGMQFEHGPLKSFKMGFCYIGTDTLSWPYQDRVTSKWKDGLAELTVITKFRNDKTSIRFLYNFMRDMDGHPSGLMERVSELGLVHEFNKHQQLHIGQTFRLPIGHEAKESFWEQDLPEKAMIARNFGDTRSFGVRNIGKYKYMDYDIGLYDSTRYWREFGNGLEFDGWVNFKPLANLDSNKFGKLTLGTGVSAGKNNDAYGIWGAFVGYRYKKLYNKFEYAYANGSNGNAGYKEAKAEGFYDTLIFSLTDKLDLIGCFDYFNPNTAKPNHVEMEYIGGISYKLTSCIKLIAAYTYERVTNGEFGHKVQLQARVKI